MVVSNNHRMIALEKDTTAMRITRKLLIIFVRGYNQNNFEPKRNINKGLVMCYSLDMILPLERQLEIDAIIENIAIATGVSYPRNSLTEIVKAVGIKLIIDDLSDIDPNMSGAIKYDDEHKKTNPVIFINSIHSINRQRFTLAHELGHFFLHNGLKLRVDNLNYADNNDENMVKEETEANYFAASLLMPKEPFLQKVKEGYSDIELGSYFGVSVEAARNRRRWLRKKINR